MIGKILGALSIVAVFGGLITLLVFNSIDVRNQLEAEDQKTLNLCRHFGGELVKDTCIKSPFEVIELGDYR